MGLPIPGRKGMVMPPPYSPFLMINFRYPAEKAWIRPPFSQTLNGCHLVGSAAVTVETNKHRRDSPRDNTLAP
ncbi:hypothetical protein RRG08_037328 [Elysia crispata]|uniref:Uncharacterized protein n=1 Tax=Elysia crispata TaxID=231223 RepID=A0AAE1DXU6_9GAST|nr:hypothetical protein RRG08_037328 [Elysia crispata]